ncbi:phosphatidate cytidylyltransferase [Hydrogenothermus marinus]|uniref:Phosphatidate cytidylyltransferase n=1 Tax=Hydrogenothermus marinus TaxID=133270 RepID=A0A3M0B8Q9_9AQUI|nr:phosphatidate cytidylyltransferase [Hydrogenothermus marinus]RMA92519.1 phosphatidate cytidylyltransferase [Hydrogenothermus marinus]
MSNLIKRVISAIVLGAIAILGVLYLNKIIFFIIVSIVSALAGWEIANLISKKIGNINSIFFSFIAFISSLSLFFISPFLSILIIFIYGFYIANKYWNIDLLAYITFGLVYSSFFISSLGFLFEIDRYILFILFATVWAGDSLAYFIGKNFGKHKLAPKLSPKKTIEGAIGSTVGSLFFGGLTAYYFNHLEAIIPIFIGAILMQIGDLFESFIKRQVGVKDSSNIIPGHGGILDRIDGLIFASVTFLIFYQIY